MIPSLADLALCTCMTLPKMHKNAQAADIQVRRAAEILQDHQRITVYQMREALCVSGPTAHRIMHKLEDLKLARQQEPRKARGLVIWEWAKLQ